jgi:predicted enzyme related to lactoylglutathione lyase
VPASPKPSVVIFVADVRRVSAFYRQLASMTVDVDDESHVVLGMEGFQLVVHGLRGEPAIPAASVRARENSYVKVCLPVASIAAARSIAAEYGGVIKPAAHEWIARGFRACDGHDPEGNVIQVREPAG